MPPRLAGWRALQAFWLAVLVLAGGTAATLAVLGPPHAKKLAAPPATPAQPPVDHSNNTAWPGPHPATAPAIAPPNTLLLEPAPDFPGKRLPRRGPAGRTAAKTYAAPVPPGTGPKIAVVLTGIGLDATDSQAAITTLPGSVDLAISAYAPDISLLLAQARDSGHETLISLPMEPAGAPSHEEGPRALRTTATAAENARSLQWALSRIEGYVGATAASDGQFGEAFTASPASMQPVREELTHRGLLYLDPAKADALIAASDGQPAIAKKLAALESAATANGQALAVFSRPSPNLVTQLTDWIAAARSRGFVLVPASVLLPAP